MAIQIISIVILRYKLLIKLSTHELSICPKTKVESQANSTKWNKYRRFNNEILYINA